MVAKKFRATDHHFLVCEHQRIQGKLEMFLRFHPGWRGRASYECGFDKILVEFWLEGREGPRPMSRRGRLPLSEGGLPVRLPISKKEMEEIGQLVAALSGKYLSCKKEENLSDETFLFYSFTLKLRPC